MVARIAAIALCVLLGAFYLWVAQAARSPSAAPEYRAYYIERTATAPSPPRYAATPADGVDFARPGVPEFVASMTGASSVQRWGRWTDPRLGDTVRLDYRRPWSGDVYASLLAAPSARHAGKAAVLRIGPTQGRFDVDAGEPRWHRVQFSLERPVAQVEIVPAYDEGSMGPGPHAPPHERTALALRKLVVEPGRCAEPFVRATRR